MIETEEEEAEMKKQPEGRKILSRFQERREKRLGKDVHKLEFLVCIEAWRMRLRRRTRRGCSW